MLLELYIFYEIVIIGLFIASFFTRQEVLWAITIVISGVLSLSSYNIEQYVYQYNGTAGAYAPVIVSFSYPYLMAINVLFFSLGLVFFMFDIFEKYQWKTPFKFKRGG